MAEREQNEASGQQQPIGQQKDAESDKQSRQQPEGQSAQQELDQTDRQQQDLQPEGRQTDESPSSFVGGQRQDSGEYLQEDGNPESGFAEQGQGASDQSDVERGIERSQNRESDIEGSSDRS
jgi:hypothetical protein